MMLKHENLLFIYWFSKGNTLGVNKINNADYDFPNFQIFREMTDVYLISQLRKYNIRIQNIRNDHNPHKNSKLKMTKGVNSFKYFLDLEFL